MECWHEFCMQNIAALRCSGWNDRARSNSKGCEQSKRSFAKSRKEIVIKTSFIILVLNVQPYKYWMEIIYLNGYLLSFLFFFFTGRGIPQNCVLYSRPTRLIMSVDVKRKESEKRVEWEKKKKQMSKLNRKTKANPHIHKQTYEDIIQATKWSPK